MSEAVSAEQEFEAAFEEAVATRRRQGAAEDGGNTPAEKAPGKQAAPSGPQAKPNSQERAQEQSQEQSQEQGQEQGQEPEGQLQALQRQLSDALHRERSSANRVSSFMRENNALKARVSELESEVSALRQRAQAITAQAGDDDDETFGEAPELRKAIERRVAAIVQPLQTELDETKDRLRRTHERADMAAQAIEPLVSRAQQAETEQIFGGLDAEFGASWRQEVATERFRTWLQTKSGAIQHLYNSGTTLHEAAEVLDLYRAQTGALGQGKHATTNSPKSPEQIAQARAAQLRNSTGIRSGLTTSKPTSATGDEFGDAFEQFAAARRKRT